MFISKSVLSGSFLCLVLSVFAWAEAVAQNSLTIVAWGGAYNLMNKKHMVEPFERETGTSVLLDAYSGGMAEIKAQVEAGRVQWDVVNLDTFTLERACSEGLLETIDANSLPKGDDGTAAVDDFLPGAVTECGVAVDIYATVMGYNKNTIGAVLPNSFADVFDTTRIPGKRAFQRRATNLMEWALIADGVPKDQIYNLLATELGQARAFAKIDSIKQDIVWFDSWSQAPQLLNDGGALLVQAPHGRYYDAIRNNKSPFVILWDGMIYDFDVWVVVKDTPRRDLAMSFVRYSTSSKPLAGVTDLSYSPTRRSSLSWVEMDELLRTNLPTSNLEVGMQANSEFWADHGEALDIKFAEWLLTN